MNDPGSDHNAKHGHDSGADDDLQAWASDPGDVGCDDPRGIPRRPIPQKGRGAVSNPVGRFETRSRSDVEDGWDLDADEPTPLATQVTEERAKSIVSYNDSPDLGFDRSVNPYRGCEHGCVYCYARPSHAYLNLSPGLDFETRLYFKANAAILLEQALAKRGYTPATLALGSNTDPYQPIEREHRITRQVLELLLRCRHPVGVVTKAGALVQRDLDLYAEFARLGLCEVGITLVTLDPALKRGLEPRAASANARLKLIEALASRGVSVRVLLAPIIPFVNDAEIERVLEAAANAGASTASYAFLRLPWEVKDLFREWLQTHAPLRAAHVMSLVQQSRQGKDYVSTFGERMRGSGEVADMIAQRFRLASRKLGLDRQRPQLRTDLFIPPTPPPKTRSKAERVPGAQDQRQGSLF